MKLLLKCLLMAGIILFTSCAGSLPSARTQSNSQFGPSAHINSMQGITDHDKDFKAPDVDKDDYSFQDKTSYVILGIAVAAITVAAVAVPIVLLTR